MGFGAVALRGLLAEASPADPLAPRPVHHRPRAKSVLFLYMDGGVSHIDSFDPKPRLAAENGRPFAMTIQPTQFNNNGNTLASPWKFARHGESGIPVSELFPHLAGCVDDLAIVRSMTSEFSEHTNAIYYLHTGHGLQGRPSMGAWLSYGLGNESRDLPGFMVLNGGLIPPGGIENFGNGFLPASYQGSIVKPQTGIANTLPVETPAGRQRSKLDLVRALDERGLDRLGAHDALESAIVNQELAFRMQTAVPDLLDLSGETRATKALYGLESDWEQTRIFGAECLLARRLVERGVRFVELTCPAVAGRDRWDAHSGLVANHTDNARSVDQPIAGLLKDLKARGLLDETLVVWAGEFGRTPFAQGSDGRDHNPFGFTIWLAGGGVKGGVVHGATDEYGYYAVEGKIDVHDLHATMLHLLGIDHKRLTYRYSGRDFRLTDVYGEILTPILA